MEFASRDDMAYAVIFTLRYLPLLVRSFEAGLEALGLEIIERSQFVDGKGTASPVLVARSKRLRLRLELRHAFEELLTVDREEKLPRVDRHLADEDYAREKLSEIVAGRLAVVKALAESRNAREAKERVGELGGRFAWLRAVFVEDADGEGPGAPSRGGPDL
jgi:hypothetical protein